MLAISSTRGETSRAFPINGNVNASDPHDCFPSRPDVLGRFGKAHFPPISTIASSARITVTRPSLRLIPMPISLCTQDPGLRARPPPSFTARSEFYPEFNSLCRERVIEAFPIESGEDAEGLG